MPLDARVRVCGDGSPPAALFIHGAASSGRIWLKMLSRMPGGTFLLADIPGMGEAALPSGSRVSFADWLSPLRDVGAGTGGVGAWPRDVAGEGRGARKCHLIGHSLGAAIAMHLAQEEWVDSVTLVSPATRSFCAQLSAASPPHWPADRGSEDARR